MYHAENKIIENLSEEKMAYIDSKDHVLMHRKISLNMRLWCN